MKYHLCAALVLALVASGCVYEVDLQDPTWSSWNITEEECEDDFAVPFTDDAGQACNLPADQATCQSIDWDKDDPPDMDHACFGFSEDIDQCTNCNRLDLPSSGPTQWSLCRNQQYMDCLMNGHLGDYGDLCFVTRHEDVQHDAGVQPRVTEREICYYLQKKGTFPPACAPDACEADAGMPDSSVADGGVIDSSVADSSVADGGAIDSSVGDAGVIEAPVQDASAGD